MIHLTDPTLAVIVRQAQTASPQSAKDLAIVQLVHTLEEVKADRDQLAEAYATPPPGIIHRNMAGAIMVNADLTNSDLTSTILTNANLTNSDLTNADFTNTILTGANLTNCDLTNADFTNATLTGTILTGTNLTGVKGLPEAPHVPDLAAKILAETEDGNLDMRTWHTCETTHCMAGWAIHFAGREGYDLESQLSPSVAAALIFQASGLPIPDFFAAHNATAIDWLREHAKT